MNKVKKINYFYLSGLVRAVKRNFIPGASTLTSHVYNLDVDVGTRNHKGAFVRHTIYKLMGIESSGWALICQDASTCHYVDPDSLREVRHPAGSQLASEVYDQDSLPLSQPSHCV